MNLHDWRKTEGISQVEAAKRLGITQSAWSRYENGHQRPGARILANIQRLTGGKVTPMDFFSDSTTPTDAPATVEA